MLRGHRSVNPAALLTKKTCDVNVIAILSRARQQAVFALFRDPRTKREAGSDLFFRIAPRSSLLDTILHLLNDLWVQNRAAVHRGALGIHLDRGRKNLAAEKRIAFTLG
jgi:hypothetical protein